ncbi:pilus assembly protein TadG-related protein [Aurantimonas sp. VKM B-3413]|uniref:pilus assembly protein TadG-related protein n=1 Tax=Aurantimonas sp. VKM B-3413 TaxID=2779401 RepID=UPI00210733CD|nr:pilus assembly protein TadG-related protein [Aurantimonas sp. VKM B-3413]MCB8837654.1 VWA domain-containing protein [Aurantimonas sp. VKM B-3413]
MAVRQRCTTAVFHRLRRAALGFGRDRSGNFGVVAALTAVPLILAMGGGVDYSNAFRIRTDLQSAADAAVLAAARYSGTDETERQRQADLLFNANVKDGVQVTATRLSHDEKKYTYDVQFTVPTAFLSLMHVNSLSMSVEAVSAHSDLPLDIALVLDSTGSMGSSGKMTQMKAAVKLFVSNFADMNEEARVQMAMVPFDTQVQVEDVEMTINGLPNVVTCSALASSTDRNYCNTDSTGFTAGTSKTYGNGSNSVLYETKKTSTQLVATKTARSCFWIFCSNDPPTTIYSATKGKITGPFSGCITDRDQPYDVRPDEETVANPATLYIPGETCQSTLAPVTALTGDLDAIAIAVDDLEPTGNTNITIGVQWGMEALTASAPLKGANTDKRTRRIMILLTDGENTQNRLTSNTTMIDGRTELACTNAKAMGNADGTPLELYTIRVIDGNETLLKKCATDSGHYYSVKQASDLTKVFQDIAERVKRIRIVS